MWDELNILMLGRVDVVEGSWGADTADQKHE